MCAKMVESVQGVQIEAEELPQPTTQPSTSATSFLERLHNILRAYTFLNLDCYQIFIENNGNLDGNNC